MQEIWVPLSRHPFYYRIFKAEKSEKGQTPFSMSAEPHRLRMSSLFLVFRLEIIAGRML
jgi:hypothetical protein